MFRRWILANIEFAKELLELILLVDVIVVFEHGKSEALTETARANEEEILVGIFYILDERSLVHIVAILHHHVFKVLHAVRDAFAINPLLSFSYSHSSIFCCKGTPIF